MHLWNNENKISRESRLRWVSDLYSSLQQPWVPEITLSRELQQFATPLNTMFLYCLFTRSLHAKRASVQVSRTRRYKYLFAPYYNNLPLAGIWYLNSCGSGFYRGTYGHSIFTSFPNSFITYRIWDTAVSPAKHGQPSSAILQRYVVYTSSHYSDVVMGTMAS